jgi:dephospho-CoA kinase
LVINCRIAKSNLLLVFGRGAIVIGLTGSIGSGKSTVSTFLAELGAVVIDADEIGHRALEPNNEIGREVVHHFGTGILKSDDEVDRQKLGEIVFNDAKILKQLNQIMHPRMYRIVEQRIEKFKEQGFEVIVLEAAALLEANWTFLVDQVWVTVASEKTIIDRVRQRSNLSEAQVLARINSQLPTEEKVKHADAVINTDCARNEVKARVEELWQELHLKAKSP